MENLDDQIERYLLGELSGDALTQFEKALQTDTALQVSVARHRELLERLEALRLRKKVQQALATEDVLPAKKPLFFSHNFIWAAAACVFLCLVAWWFVTPKNPENVVNIAEKPLPPTDSASAPAPPPPPVLPSKAPAPARVSPMALATSFHRIPDAASLRDITAGNQGAKTLTQMAKEAFVRGEYALVAEMLKTDASVEDENARYLRGHARFQIGQFPAAAADFETLQNSFQYKHDARWNFLLCQVALDKKVVAKSLLSGMLADLDFPYRKEALALSKQL